MQAGIPKGKFVVTMQHFFKSLFGMGAFEAILSKLGSAHKAFLLVEFRIGTTCICCSSGTKLGTPTSKWIPNRGDKQDFEQKP